MKLERVLKLEVAEILVLGKRVKELRSIVDTGSREDSIRLDQKITTLVIEPVEKMIQKAFDFGYTEGKKKK